MILTVIGDCSSDYHKIVTPLAVESITNVTHPFHSAAL